LKDSASRDGILADPNAHLENPDILSKPENENKFKDIIGQSEKMQKIFRIIEKISPKLLSKKQTIYPDQLRGHPGKFIRE